MKERFSVLLARVRQRLWFKPLSFCILSSAGVFLASLLEMTYLEWFLPDLST